MAVSAFSEVSNFTTPVPRERPLSSYWISARSTVPIVVKSSTRSSLLVDQGSCRSEQRYQNTGGQRTYIANVDELARLSSRRSVVGEGIGWCSARSRSSTVERATCRRTTVATASVASTTAITASKASTSTETASKASPHATSETATTSKAAAWGSSKSVFANF